MQIRPRGGLWFSNSRLHGVRKWRDGVLKGSIVSQREVIVHTASWYRDARMPIGTVADARLIGFGLGRHELLRLHRLNARRE